MKVKEDDLPICERQHDQTVDVRDVGGWAVGRSSVRAGDLDQLRSVTCTSPQDDATVKCWGGGGEGSWQSYGQLGYGDTSSRGDDSNGVCPA